MFTQHHHLHAREVLPPEVNASQLVPKLVRAYVFGLTSLSPVNVGRNWGGEGNILVVCRVPCTERTPSILL